MIYLMYLPLICIYLYFRFLGRDTRFFLVGKLWRELIGGSWMDVRCRIPCWVYVTNYVSGEADLHFLLRSRGVFVFMLLSDIMPALCDMQQNLPISGQKPNILLFDLERSREPFQAGQIAAVVHGGHGRHATNFLACLCPKSEQEREVFKWPATRDSKVHWAVSNYITKRAKVHLID